MTEFLKSIPFDYEPKRQNRFFVKFPDEFGIELWKVQRINKPTLFGTTLLSARRRVNSCHGVVAKAE